MSRAIKQYISSKYDQHPDMFTDDLQSIDTLRDSAVNSLQTYSTNLLRLHKYAAQLVWMTSRFPIDVINLFYQVL